MLNDYYANPDVRSRLVEFLGGTKLDDATAQYITADGSSHAAQFHPKPVGDLQKCIRAGLDVGRSLWDSKSLLAHLDIEYVNFDYPAEPYLEPSRTFEVQRPVSHSIQSILLKHGIAPLHLMSGRGHHFVWQIDSESQSFERLAKLGQVPTPLAARYATPQAPCGNTVGSQLASAYSGLGMLLEYVAHLVIDACSQSCSIPIELTAVEAGPGARGREIISIDLSEYGDPLCTRGIRMPFSAYLKIDQERWKFGDVGHRLPHLFMIPLHEMDENRGLLVMRDLGQVKELARRASVQIPNQTLGTESLIDEYQQSTLAKFHQQFYSVEHDTPHRWPHTYDRTPLDPLPPCVRRLLQQPNDLLVKPAGIQHLVRVLMAIGWHPRHISGLIRSKYERDHQWGNYWYRYDATSRADFYTRLFAGLFTAGRDPLIDFNCRSTQEKGYCPQKDCTQNLEEYRNRLLSLRNGRPTRLKPAGSEAQA